MKVYALLHKSFYEKVSLFSTNLPALSKLRKVRAAMAFTDDFLQTFDCTSKVISLLISHARLDEFY